MELDRLDIAILNHLQTHGRATAGELSEVAALPPSPIQRYVALLDQDRVGLPVNVLVTVKLANHTDEMLRGFESAVATMPEVMEMYEMTGSTDFLLWVVAADVASYETFLRGKLTHIPGVQSFESQLALKRVVYRTNLPLRARG